MALAGCGDSSSADVAASAAPEVPRLQAAYEGCRRGSDPDKTVTVADTGKTLVVDTRSESGDLMGVECVLRALGTPESVRASVSSTTALMGVLTAEDDGLYYSWSYHPNNGLNMVIKDAP